MNILFTICARAGSKGVVSKNTRDFLGFPICTYTLSALGLFRERHGNEYGILDLAVNTDSPRLFGQVDACSETYIRVDRTEELAGDFASKIDVIRDTFAKAQSQSGHRYDLVVDMDLTSPLRRVRDIRNVIRTLVGTQGAEVAMTVCEARRNPYFNQLAKGEDGFYHTVVQSNFVARQQAPRIFDANASLYAYSPAFLVNSDAIILRAKLAVSEMPDTAVLDIDSESDFLLMQILARHFYDTDGEYGEIRDRIPLFFHSQQREKEA